LGEAKIACGVRSLVLRPTRDAQAALDGPLFLDLSDGPGSDVVAATRASEERKSPQVSLLPPPTSPSSSRNGTSRNHIAIPTGSGENPRRKLQYGVRHSTAASDEGAAEEPVAARPLGLGLMLATRSPGDFDCRSLAIGYRNCRNELALQVPKPPGPAHNAGGRQA
jgi:hypothetical protein